MTFVFLRTSGLVGWVPGVWAISHQVSGATGVGKNFLFGMATQMGGGLI